MSNDRIPAHYALGSTQDQPTSQIEAVRRGFLALQAAVKSPPLEKNDLDAALQCYAARLVELSLSLDALGSSSLTGDVGALLENLGKQLYVRYDQTENIDHLNSAVECSRLATKLTASDHPDYKTRLDFLAGLLETRFRSEALWPDIVDAVQLTRAAVIATDHNDDEVVRRWSDLGERLGRLYGSGGTIADLDEGIRYLSQAVKVIEDPIFLYDPMIELAFCLELRFEELAEIEDLDKAISLRRQALQATDDQDESWLYCLRDLGCDMEARYIHTGELSDLQEAIREAYNAIKAMVAISPEVRAAIRARVNVFRHLENLLTLRHKKTHQINGCEEATRWAEEAAKWEKAYH
jgi:tetratricopeptide (TPR) repeat protein